MDPGIGPTDNITFDMPHVADNNSASHRSSKWHFCGHVFPRSEIVFFIQVLMVFIVAIVSIVNITMQHPDSQLWIALLSSSVGYLLPSPKMHK